MSHGGNEPREAADELPPVTPPWARPTVYGAPRRFDLATLFTVSLAYALLFATLRALQVPPAATAMIGLFITGVGGCQAFLFGGKRPREASMVGGVAVYLVLGSAVSLWNWTRGRQPLLPGIAEAILAATCGIVHGYLAGVIVGGVFLTADRLRQVLRYFRGRKMHRRTS